jgi:hypothetical protein
VVAKCKYLTTQHVSRSKDLLGMRIFTFCMINSILLRLISYEVYSSNSGIIDGSVIMNDTEVKKKKK